MVKDRTSPYGFFVKMCYERHRKKYPNEEIEPNDLSRKCSERWKVRFSILFSQISLRGMTEDQKNQFFDLAKQDAERFRAEAAAFVSRDKRKKKKSEKDPNAPKRPM